MAMQEAAPALVHTPEFVGNAFVDQYYPILHRNPELLYKFYQDSSVLSRPDSSGHMTTVTTLEASTVGFNTALHKLHRWCFPFLFLMLWQSIDTLAITFQNMMQPLEW